MAANTTTTKSDHSLRGWMSDFLPIGRGGAPALRTAETTAPTEASQTATKVTQPAAVVVSEVSGVKRRAASVQ